MWRLMEQVQTKRPTVHAITNYVSANDVANAILAVGALPIMAEYHGEVEEITSRASALVLNMGLLHPDKLMSMKKAGRVANERSVPVILDPVGCMSSGFRNLALRELLSEMRFAVIRGNFSEMLCLSGEKVSGKGVDDCLNGEHQAQKIGIARMISKEYGCVAVITGETDIVSDGEKVCCLKNGTRRMSEITGIGCMLSGILGAFVGANPDKIMEASLFACNLLSVAGELADQRAEEQGLGTGTMRSLLIDYLSRMDEKRLMERVRMTEVTKSGKY